MQQAGDGADQAVQLDEGLQLAGDREGGLGLGALQGLELLLDDSQALLDGIGLG